MARHNACRARFCIKRKGAMLDNRQLDLWADGYDKSTGLADEAQTYPFAGYKAVLHAIYGRVLASGQKQCWILALARGCSRPGCMSRGWRFMGGNGLPARRAGTPLPPAA